MSATSEVLKCTSVTRIVIFFSVGTLTRVQPKCTAQQISNVATCHSSTWATLTLIYQSMYNTALLYVVSYVSSYAVSFKIFLLQLLSFNSIQFYTIAWFSFCVPIAPEIIVTWNCLLQRNWRPWRLWNTDFGPMWFWKRCSIFPERQLPRVISQHSSFEVSAAFPSPYFGGKEVNWQLHLEWGKSVPDA